MGDLQGGIALAAKSTDRKSVWAAAGTYKPNDSSPTNLSRAQSFALKNGVAVHGGFAGTETEIDQRDIAANPTILSGDIGASGDYDNCEHVVSNSGLGATAVLDGFTITGGNSESDGGGMLNINASPTVRNCVFAKNYAANDGAGMHNKNSSPNLSDCAFRENSAEDGGGALYNCVGSSPILTNCSFSFNSANIIVMPLVLGIAVDSGIYIINRYRREDESPAQVIFSSTGIGVLLNTLTIMASFGALMVAHHRGVFSIGAVMSLGMLACQVAFVLVLPAVLELFGKRKQG